MTLTTLVPRANAQADAKSYRGFGIIAPGAGWPSKLWPAERFAAVAAHLGNQRQLPTLVISGNEQERAWAPRSRPALADTPGRRRR